MDFSQFTTPQKTAKEKKLTEKLLKEKSEAYQKKPKPDDYIISVKSRVNWDGKKIVIKVTHIVDKYVEAVVTCKEEKYEKVLEKVVKEYKALGKVRIEREDDNKGDIELTRDDSEK